MSIRTDPPASSTSVEDWHGRGYLPHLDRPGVPQVAGLVPDAGPRPLGSASRRRDDEGRPEASAPRLAASRYQFSVILSLLLLLAAGCASPGPATPVGVGRAAGSGPSGDLPSVTTIARAQPGQEDVLLATTTSTRDSGLLDVLLPDFRERTGYRLKPIAVGTGQALALGKRGEADVLLVHAPSAELELVQSSDAVGRRLVMHNDFVVVGPAADPAGVKGTKQAVKAFKKLAERKAIFVSRGDESGTHLMERSLWAKAGAQPAGEGYLQTGAGMGQTLDVASERGGYTLTDRATYLAMRQRVGLEIVLEGDAPLLNIYHVMVVNPEKHPKVNAAGGKAFADYLVSRETQALIGGFGREQYGQPLFFSDAGRPEPIGG